MLPRGFSRMNTKADLEAICRLSVDVIKEKGGWAIPTA